MVTESVKDWALIIHADSAGSRVDVYWVDIEAGRKGLALANEVRQWRRRDDLLVIGNRTVVELAPQAAPASPAETPALPPVALVEASRVASRREYLTGRVRAILAHSQLAAKHLQIEWPKGIPGLKNDGHSWDDLDAILEAVELVEKNHSVPFYPQWNDPVEESKIAHPSHSRSDLANRWLQIAIDNGNGSSIDQTALAHTLAEFLKLDENEWPDDDLTVMLDGSLRALGYNGIRDLGKFNPNDAPLLMSAAFAIAAGNAMLLFDENENPIVRTNVRKP